MGFCWGGGVTNQVAVHSPDLTRRRCPSTAASPQRRTWRRSRPPCWSHYAGDDERINAGIPAFEEALKKAGVEYQIHTYEGAGHAFNDTNPRDTTRRPPSSPGSGPSHFFKKKLGQHWFIISTKPSTIPGSARNPV